MIAWEIEDIIEKFKLDKDSVFIDLGTNRGQEIDHLLPLGIETHSFEPHPKFAEKVRENYSNYTNLIFHEKAAWIKNENRKFYFKRGIEGNNGGATLKTTKTNINVKDFVEVQCIDLSEYILSLGKKIDVLKIDTEGSEYDILEHLIKTNAIDLVVHIFAEDHSRKMNDADFFIKKKWVLAELDKRGKSLKGWM